MTTEELIEGNELIADFLEWKESDRLDDGILLYKVPNNFYEDTGWIEWAVDSFLFDNDWNWIMYLWGELHRKVCIPMIRDNQHLKFLRPIVQETKKAIIWGHKETAYRNCVKLIKLYNLQFDK